MDRASRWIKCVLGGLTILASGGVIYQALSTARDRRRYPPPGRLIDIGGHRLHLNCLGEGRPSVVLECGSGSVALDWSLVQAEVSKWTCVCAYDRAGHGWSDPSRSPRTIQQIVDELHTLLVVGGIQAPYILVGHSLGGLYIQYFARQFPAEVAGMVLVDSSHPDLYSRLPPTVPRKAARALKKRWLAALFGVMRLGILAVPTSGKLPSEVQQIISTLALRPSYWSALISQNKHLGQQVSEVFNRAGPFPKIPLVVLTPPDADWTSEVDPTFPALWLEAQTNLATLSPYGTLVIAEESGHMITHDQPVLVADAIRQVVEAARRQ